MIEGVCKGDVMDVVHIGRPLQQSAKWKGGTSLRRAGPDKLPETAVHYPQHGFTHVDAPCHMIRGGAALEDCRLSQLCNWASLVDVSDTVPSGAVTAELLEARAGHARPGDILLLRSGLSERFSSESPEYTHESPYVDASGSRWIAENGFCALAIDFPQDYLAREMSRRVVRTHEFTEHQIVLGAGLMHLEHVRGLDQLKTERVFLAGLPLRLAGRADGGPASPVVLTDCPSHNPSAWELSLPVDADWRGRVERFFTLSFESGDQVQETGVQFAGPSHTHVLTPRYVDPDAAGVDGWIGTPLVRDYDIVDLADLPDGRGISRSALETRFPEPNRGAVLLRTGYMDRVPYTHLEWEERSPWLETDAAQFLVDKGCSVVALDFEADAGRKRLKGETPSLAELDAEKIILGSGAALVKNLQATTALTGQVVTLVVMPLLLPGAESAPARVVGLKW